MRTAGGVVLNWRDKKLRVTERVLRGSASGPRTHTRPYTHPPAQDGTTLVSDGHLRLRVILKQDSCHSVTRIPAKGFPARPLQLFPHSKATPLLSVYLGSSLASPGALDGDHCSPLLCSPRTWLGHARGTREGLGP